MSTRTLLHALACALICAPVLAGCTTPRVQPEPSAAVLQARANAAAHKAAACTPGGLDAISPVDVGFGFDDAELSDPGQRRLAAAVAWLGCNPGVEVVILPDADNHGDAAHLADLAQKRALAVQARLRSLGATATVIRLLPRGAADPVTGPHLVINAQGRGW
jgi:outer membrane protein OmpA-like peptidoglycan-associated protein